MAPEPHPRLERCRHRRPAPNPPGRPAGPPDPPSPRAPGPVRSALGAPPVEARHLTCHQPARRASRPPRCRPCAAVATLLQGAAGAKGRAMGRHARGHSAPRRDRQSCRPRPYDHPSGSEYQGKKSCPLQEAYRQRHCPEVPRSGADEAPPGTPSRSWWPRGSARRAFSVRTGPGRPRQH